jgi:hypothetical protein
MAGNKDVRFTVSAEDKASSTVKQVEKAIDGLKERAKGLLEVLGAFGIGLGLGEFFKTSIEQAIEADAAWRRLENSIGNVGGSFAELKPQIDATIESLAKQSTYKPDELVAGLERLTTTSGDAKGSIEAMGLATNIAAARHIDLETAATLVGKVMSGNTTALKKFGITLKDGDDAMNVLQHRFAGFAQVEAESFGGQLKKVKNGFEEFTEAVGKAIIGNDEAGKSVGGMVGFLAQLEAWVTKNADGIGEFVTVVVEVASVIGTVLKVAFTLAVGAALALNLGVETIVFTFAQLYASSKVAIGGVSQIIGELLDRSAPVFEAFGINVDDVGDKLANWGTKLKNAGLKDERENLEVIATSAARVGDFFENGFGKATVAVKEHTEAQKELHSKVKEGEDGFKNLRTQFDALARSTAEGKTKAQEFADKMATWKTAAEAAGLPIDELTAKMRTLTTVLNTIKQDEFDKAFQEGMTALLAHSGAALDKLAAQWDTEIKKISGNLKFASTPEQKAAIQAQIDSFQKLKSASIELAAALGMTESVLEQIKQQTATASLLQDLNGIETSMSDAAAVVEVWDARVKAAKPGTDDYKTATAELAKAQDALNAATAAYGAYFQHKSDIINQGTADAQKHSAAIYDAASKYSNLARSAIAAGQAVGGFSAETAAALQNVVSLADGVAKLFASGGTDVGAWAQSIASLAAIVSQIFGGNSKEDLAKQHVTDQNTAAIEKLTNVIGAMNLNISGTDLACATAMMAQLFGPGGLSGFDAKDKAPTSGKGAYAGLDDAFLKEIAKKLGITIDDTAGSWAKLKEALGDVTGHLAQFGETLSDQEALGNAAVKFFGLSGTAAFGAQNNFGVKQSPILSKIFGGQSIEDFLGAGGGDPKKIQDAMASVIDIFKQLAAGKISDKDLGGLTGSELFKILQSLFDGLTGLKGAATDTAVAVVSAAQKMSAAAAALSEKWDVYGTDSVGQAADLQTTFGYKFDLSTQAGRDAAIKALESEYEGSKTDAAKVANIRTMLHAIRALPKIAVTDTGGGTGVGASASEAIGNGSSLAKAVSNSASAGLASASYAQFDTFVSIAQQSMFYLRDIRDFMMGGRAGSSGPVSIQVGTIEVNCFGVTDSASATMGAQRGVDAALGAARVNLRAAVGVPRVS